MWSGVVFASTFLVAALMAPYWGRRADRSGKRRMIMRAGIMLSLAYFIGAWVRNPVELICVRIFQGFASGFVPASMALVASSAPPEKLGFCMGIMQTALVIGGIVGPLMGGTLSHLFGMRMSFVVAGVILSAGTVAVGWLVVEPERLVAPPETSLAEDLKTAFRNQVLVRMLLLLFAVVLAPIYEEMLFRRVLFGRLWRDGWPLLGAVCSAVLFAFMHEPPLVGDKALAAQLPLWLVYTCMGLAFAWVYRRTGSLVAPIIAHGLNNAFAIGIMLPAGPVH